jgi:hypothetical protein
MAMAARSSIPFLTRFEPAYLKQRPLAKHVQGAAHEDIVNAEIEIPAIPYRVIGDGAPST